MKKEVKNRNRLSEPTNNDYDIHYLQNFLPLRSRILRPLPVLVAILTCLFCQYYGSEVLTSLRSFCLSIGIDLPLLGLILLALVGIAMFVVIYTFVHEIIHIVACGNKMKCCKLLFSKGTVSVVCDCWFIRSHHLFIQIAPFVFIEAIAGAVGIIANNIFAFLFITLFNFILSLSDIFSFFFVLFMTPSNCLINGNAPEYRHQ